MTGSIVILTGAGISAESGLGTFRDKGGVWSKYPLEKLATPQGFQDDPEFVYAFYNMRREKMRDAVPNAAHFALAALAQNYDGDVTIITQNIDNLHEKAGAPNVIHMHGESLRYWCVTCGYKQAWDQPFDAVTACAACAKTGGLRPDVVWFGEMPYHMSVIESALRNSALFVSIGTSGNVYPASGFVRLAKQSGAETLELNLEPSEGAQYFDRSQNGLASQIVPEWVKSIIGGQYG